MKKQFPKAGFIILAFVLIGIIVYSKPGPLMFSVILFWLSVFYYAVVSYLPRTPNSN